MLEPAYPNPIPNQIQPTPLPLIIEDQPEFEISDILDTKIDNRRRCKLQYLVRWTGYKGTDEETSWINATELGNATELVADFHLAYPSSQALSQIFEVQTISLLLKFSHFITSSTKSYYSLRVKSGTSSGPRPLSSRSAILQR